MPKRIQRKRTKGWRMPQGAVYVGRPSKWGNPFPVINGNQENAVKTFRRWLRSSPAGRKLAMEARQELAGKDLACWCPLKDKSSNPAPCHADVLLQIANEVNKDETK